MEEKQCIRHRNRLEVELHVNSTSADKELFPIIKSSSEYMINGLVVFQVKMNIFRIIRPDNKSKCHASLNITLRKTLKTDAQSYAIKCYSFELNIRKPITLYTDDTPWRQIYEYCNGWDTTSEYKFTFKLVLQLDLQSSSSIRTPASLHNDTDLTDFELRGKDGSVHVHKAILAGYSSVLQTMITGDWREAKEGSVNVEGTTKETLQHLKDYMYNDKLPENDLEHLMALSQLGSCYMMEDLVQKCSFKLLTYLSAQNTVELVEFALKYKQKHLFLAIIKNLECGCIKVKDIEDTLFDEKAAESDEQIIK